MAWFKAAAHRLAIATAIGNLQSSNDLRLRFQRQNQATMHTALALALRPLRSAATVVTATTPRRNECYYMWEK